MSNKDIKPVTILTRADYLEGVLNMIPGISIEDLDGSRKAYRDATDAAVKKIMGLPHHPARVSNRTDGTAIHMMGLSATSTTGFEGAARNWIKQARTKFGGQEHA
ncbi:MAG: hypothetical protein CSA70_03550 [Rhodobacterales bacterium]|nr:MAG: hypothetical protein CSA70_03550 [Rhodobacterales bacterium]